MMTCNAVFKRIMKLGMLLMMGISMTACGAGSKKWKEEVQLSDGKVIVIERELVLESGGGEWASNRNGTKPKENRIRFASLDNSGKVIEWHSTKTDISIRPEIPLVLDVESGRLIVFSSISDPRGCQIYSKYIYQKDVWAEEKLPPTFEQHATNLYVFQNEGLKFINLEKKR